MGSPSQTARGNMTKQHKKRWPGRTPTQAELEQLFIILKGTSEAFWRGRGYTTSPVDWTPTIPKPLRPSGKKRH